MQNKLFLDGNEDRDKAIARLYNKKKKDKEARRSSAARSGDQIMKDRKKNRTLEIKEGDKNSKPSLLSGSIVGSYSDKENSDKKISTEYDRNRKQRRSSDIISIAEENAKLNSVEFESMYPDDQQDKYTIQKD